MSCWSVNSFDFTREKLNECSFFSAKSKESTDQQDMFKFFFNHASPFYTSNNIMNKSGVKRLNKYPRPPRSVYGTTWSYCETVIPWNQTPRKLLSFHRTGGPMKQYFHWSSEDFTGPHNYSLRLTIKSSSDGRTVTVTHFTGPPMFSSDVDWGPIGFAVSVKQSRWRFCLIRIKHYSTRGPIPLWLCVPHVHRWRDCETVPEQHWNKPGTVSQSQCTSPQWKKKFWNQV